MATRINPYRRFHFAAVPVWLAQRKEVTPGAKLCYGFLIKRAGVDGSCYPTVLQLSNDLGVSDRQIKNYTQELRTHLLIETEKTGMEAPNVYYFLDHPWMEGKDSSLSGGTTVPFRGETSVPFVGKDTAPFLETVGEKQKEKNKAAPDTNVHVFIDWWFGVYQGMFHLKYKVEGGKDGKLVKRLLEQYPLETIKRIAYKLLTTTDPWLVKRGRTIATLSGEWNKLQEEDAPYVSSIPDAKDVQAKYQRRKR